MVGRQEMVGRRERGEEEAVKAGSVCGGEGVRCMKEIVKREC